MIMAQCIVHFTARKPKDKMTKDQVNRAVFMWLEGKNTWDIARALKISESDVATWMPVIHKEKRRLMDFGHKQLSGM